MGQYSDSSDLSAEPQTVDTGGLTLAVDSGSPTVSLALGSGGRLLAQTSYPGGPASPPLLEQIDTLLGSIGCHVTEIQRLIAARGPGSFTGLRTGLAALLGLCQALDVPATAVPTFWPLAAQATSTGPVVAAIDALRQEWFVQRFESPRRVESSEPRIVSPQGILPWQPSEIVAFGAERLSAALDNRSDIEFHEAAPLAPDLFSIAAEPALQWNRRLLTAPLYLRPPTASRQRGADPQRGL